MPNNLEQLRVFSEMLFHFGVQVLEAFSDIVSGIFGYHILESLPRELLLVAHFFCTDSGLDSILDSLEKELKEEVN